MDKNAFIFINEIFKHEESVGVVIYGLGLKKKINYKILSSTIID